MSFAVYDNPHTMCVECWESGKLRKFISFLAICVEPRFRNWAPPKPGQVYGDPMAIAEDMRPKTK